MRGNDNAEQESLARAGRQRCSKGLRQRDSIVNAGRGEGMALEHPRRVTEPMGDACCARSQIAWQGAPYQ
jgi:hypothetical protein